MAAEWQQRVRLDGLLHSLRQPAAAPLREKPPVVRDSASQTEHRLHSQIHAITCSKGTDNPDQDFVSHFDLCLTVAGPELDNTSNVIACSDPTLRSKITVKGKNLCFGELAWTTRRLTVASLVECKLETKEILEMSKRIQATRRKHIWKENLHSTIMEGEAGKRTDGDSGSEASTDAGSSLCYTLSDVEPSNSESETSSCDNAEHAAPSQSRRTLPSSLTTILEDERCAPAVGCDAKEKQYWTMQEHRQRLSLKTYCFQFSEAYVLARTCCCGKVLWGLSDMYAKFFKGFETKYADLATAKLKFEQFLAHKSRSPGCDGTKARLLLKYSRTLETDHEEAEACEVSEVNELNEVNEENEANDTLYSALACTQLKVYHFSRSSLRDSDLDSLLTALADTRLKVYRYWKGGKRSDTEEEELFFSADED
eukprot:TRINITY_DN3195_c1_g1_i1.p1 TRINITY_DN3195_c1_g1~~TRINITY_DN3195_c1_g1_i1.p1  ORF type:complete len:496 (-),score=72.64 TRINITY_DN3195_c1_g1_i1:130-1404(-)